MENEADQSTEISHLQIFGPKLAKAQILAWNALIHTVQAWQLKNPGMETEFYEITNEALCAALGLRSCSRSVLQKIVLPLTATHINNLVKQDTEDPSFTTFVLIPYIGFENDKLIFTISDHLKPGNQQPETLAALDLAMRGEFKHTTSAALYEWVSRFKDTPSKRTKVLAWTDLRWMLLGPIDDTSIYQHYKEFSRMKLRPSIKELNECSDLNVELLLEKGTNNQATTLQFIVQKKSEVNPT